MATEPTIDFEVLLAPLGDDTPAGVDLKESPELSPAYYAVKDARQAARLAERQLLEASMGSGDPDAPTPDPPDWNLVVKLATEVLSGKSKDLWVAAWLLEGLTRKHGFAGVRDGYRLIRELCERYWNDVHPRPDEDGLATTVAQITGLNGDGSDGALVGPILAIPLTQGESSGPLSGRDYVDAVALESKDADYRARQVEAGAAVLADFEVAARETPPEHFATVREDIAEAQAEFQQLTALLDELCVEGPDATNVAPPSSAIRNVLVQSADHARVIGGESADDAGSEEDAEEGSEAGDADGPTVAAPARAAAVGEINSRESALKALAKVADYFRRTEPHSPVSYSLEQAVRWARMPLPALLNELVSDSSTRRELSKLTGIPMPDEDDD
ncbi:MAG: type VI secretion system protein TssA [Planctomycetota bacterium]